MSERWRKFHLLVVRFTVWLTPSWLNARAMAGGRSELEDELVAWQKNCIDKNYIHRLALRVTQIRPHRVD
jgi:hypothetical protein